MKGFLHKYLLKIMEASTIKYYVSLKIYPIRLEMLEIFSQNNKTTAGSIPETNLINQRNMILIKIQESYSTIVIPQHRQQAPRPMITNIFCNPFRNRKNLVAPTTFFWEIFLHKINAIIIKAEIYTHQIRKFKLHGPQVGNLDSLDTVLISLSNKCFLHKHTYTHTHTQAINLNALLLISDSSIPSQYCYNCFKDKLTVSFLNFKTSCLLGIEWQWKTQTTNIQALTKNSPTQNYVQYQLNASKTKTLHTQASID
eukprot:TRINITY_DN25838_c0_g1_i8.p1 TRINITY_DN25838_c0_g1~~TRINITY_DN25838_c0_g1_i8.p1  ORF type:complete len:255 (-),score=-15.68 TRINITY_DN25838_c0_g1_i8:607-1371(-)